MSARPSRIWVVGLVMLGGGAARRMSTAAQGVDSRPSQPVATTDRFELRSDPRVGLLHFLIAWARADAGEWPAYAPPLYERNGWSDVPNQHEARVWQGAVSAFDASRHRSLVFDEGIIALRDWAAAIGDRQAVPAADGPMAEALEDALPIYLRHWWPRHDRQNRAWITALRVDLDRIEDAVLPKLEAAYGGRWPNGPVPVDVVSYANPVGAYSTQGRLTISSVDPGATMPQALELVFHEASHTDQLEGPLVRAVEAAFRAAGAEAPERFWHDVIFYTTGEILRIVLNEFGRPGYRHYLEVTGGYARRQRWAVKLPALESHWGPFLRSGLADEGDRRLALQQVAHELVDRTP